MFSACPLGSVEKTALWTFPLLNAHVVRAEPVGDHTARQVWHQMVPAPPLSIDNCQGLESQAGQKFYSIKLYCNEVPDGEA